MLEKMPRLVSFFRVFVFLYKIKLFESIDLRQFTRFHGYLTRCKITLEASTAVLLIHRTVVCIVLKTDRNILHVFIEMCVAPLQRFPLTARLMF